MNARPIFLKSRRKPVCAAVALALVMVAVLLAVGCVSQQPIKVYPADNPVKTTNVPLQIPTPPPVSRISVSEPIPKDNQTFYVTITSNPGTISEGEETELNVTVVTGQGTPVSGATVTISAGGGTFISSRDMYVTGKTDSSGIFRTTWGAYPPYIAGGYIMDAQVSKDGLRSSGSINRVIVYIK